MTDTAAQSQEQLERTALISNNIRQALRRALPAPVEQFFTVSVPGKVVNFELYTDGIDETGKALTALRPLAVQLEEARLVDDMPALSSVALGPTGRSVARSYEAALSKLAPAGTSIGIEGGSDEDPAEKRYKKAMAFLTEPHPNYPDKTRVDVYREKQSAYTGAFERKTKAFQEALTLATGDLRNTTATKKREAYDEWVAQNAKTYRNLVQAAYMDWVTNGKKEEIEFWFAVVDSSSAMARVEASKEAMRASVVQGEDGAVEYQKVTLTPNTWAWLAKQKASGRAPKETVQSLTIKVARLKKIQQLLEGAIEYYKPKGDTPPAPTANGIVKESAPNPIITDFLRDNDAYQNDLKQYDGTKADDAAKTELEAARVAVDNSRKALDAYFESLEKSGFAGLNSQALAQQQDLFKNDAKGVRDLISSNNQKIGQYQEQIAALQGGFTAPSYQDSLALQAGIAPDLPPPASATDNESYWTTISLEVTSSLARTHDESHSKSFSTAASGRFGLFKFSASASHNTQAAAASRQLAECKTKISFECMRVDIGRPWLRPELFYDRDLTVAPSERISPGPAELAALMDPGSYPGGAGGLKIEDWDLFPLFPTAFLLAANVVLELQGSTSEIQEHFSASQTTASASLSYGPFNLSVNYSQKDQRMDTSCEATASGCKITVKSPQIIGWISEMLPALPRKPVQ